MGPRHLVLMLVAASAALLPAPQAGAAVTNAGYPGFVFGPGMGAPTTSKPESKLWFAGGVWWASMLDPASQDHHIFRLDRAAERWLDTGTVLDPRPSARADVLWDGARGKLYVASHIWAEHGAVTGAPARLWRFSYDAASGQYTPDAGFPVDINKAATETLVIAKDSTGKLWATWTQGNRVYVSHTGSSESAWVKPYPLPVPGSTVRPGDVSSIIAYGGNRIGVMWNNSADGRFLFATHLDGGGDSSTNWSASGISVPGGLPADDHINLKADSAGRVYAAVKFATNAGLEPFVALLVREPGGSWSTRTVGTVSDSGTRPIVLLDEERQRVHVLFTGPEPPSITGQEGGTIYDKTAAMGPLSFEPGLGTPAIRDAASPALNNVTSTKQSVTTASGIVVLAANSATNAYWHGDLRLDGSTPPPSPDPAGPPPPAPLTFSFAPVADAQVKATSPSGNFGALDALAVRKDTHHSYLKFAVSGLKAPVLSAKLRLKAASTTTSGGDLFAAPATWNELQLTWANAPPVSGPPMASAGPVVPGTVELPIPPNAIAGDGTYGFVLVGGETTSTIYSSREGVEPPQLVVTTAAPPPPPPAIARRRPKRIKVRLRDLLNRRFTYRTRCTRACRVSATLVVRGWTARTLRGRGSKVRALTVAKAQAARARAGSARLVFRVPSRRLKARLARRRRLDATLTIRVVYPRAHRRFALHRPARLTRG